MGLSLSDFRDCGFPEEWLFWAIAISVGLIILTIVSLHYCVKEGRGGFFFPAIFAIHDSPAFNHNGRILRRIFIFATFVLVSAGVFLYLGYETNALTCGRFT